MLTLLIMHVHVAKTAPCCVVSDAIPTTAASIIAYDDDQQQPDNIADVTNDNLQTISCNGSDDDTKQSSPCHFPTNVINVSTAKLTTGIGHVFNTLVAI